MDIAAATSLLRIALGILTDRLITLLSLIMTFGLAAWAMWEPHIMREGMAAFFALCVFLPTLFKERQRSNEGSRQQEE